VEKKRIGDSQSLELLFLRAFASLREAISALFRRNLLEASPRWALRGKNAFDRTGIDCFLNVTSHRNRRCYVCGNPKKNMTTILPTSNDSLNAASVELGHNTSGTGPAHVESADHGCRARDQIELTIELEFDGFTDEDQFSCD
jgi:hypothetical protein